MWIMLNDAFFSVVHKDCEPNEVLVRARRPGDIKRVFGVEATVVGVADYRYRATIKRSTLKAVMAIQIDTIDYPNFKNSVQDDALHDAYLRVWHDMQQLQPRPVGVQPALHFGSVVTAKPVKPLSAAMRQALLSARDRGEATAHLSGKSAWGGWVGTRVALIKRGLLVDDNMITNEGLDAIADVPRAGRKTA